MNRHARMTDEQFLEWTRHRLVEWLDESQLQGNKNFKAFRWNHINKLVNMAEKNLDKNQ